MSYVTGISGNVFSAASAAYAPTNSADVSAIASAYAESAVSAASGNYIPTSQSSNYMQSTAIQTAYASASASQATAQGVLYILLPDGDPLELELE